MVLGLGSFGVSAALSLAEYGLNVLGVDRNREIVHALAGRLDRLAVADSTDLDALRGLGVGEAQRALVAIAQDVVTSVLTTSLLAELGVPEIWARAETVRHGRILERVGAHHVVLPRHGIEVTLMGLHHVAPSQRRV
ncbi:TrkA family potassium uptake protein [Nonomuraea sp. NN258]|uniref:potassium channel family protein n=1 Tax=Nonomuraea antri TaxID=2730852 RepID=UPI00156994A0|nr:NAD-binding protein [Nonomuraea antri]NRQ37525.1 TrkA family potassium uptake protein [Nonomuraea antri]